MKPGNHVKWCRVDAPRGPVLATIALDQGREISPVTFHIKDPGNLTVEAPKRRIIIRNIKQYGADRILLSSTSKATSLPPQNNDGISRYIQLLQPLTHLVSTSSLSCHQSIVLLRIPVSLFFLRLLYLIFYYLDVTVGARDSSQTYSTISVWSALQNGRFTTIAN